MTERWRPHPLSGPQTLRTVFPSPSPTSSCIEVKHVTSRFQVQFQYLRGSENKVLTEYLDVTQGNDGCYMI